MGQNIFAVVMAGGVGSRFWPKSRERSPKQFLKILGERSMIQQTVLRLGPLVPASNTFVVSNVLHQDLVAEQLPQLPKENILLEPFGRNTAPCIGLSALWVDRIDPEGIIVVLPADHLIAKEEEFRRVISSAARVAASTDGMVTIGIQPTHPETGYGYIQFEEKDPTGTLSGQGAFKVRTFAEKPNLETAERFLESGDFLWNSGMFVWKARTILREIATHLPDLHAQLQAIRPTLGTPMYQETVERAYGTMKGISVDYGVMERASQVYVVRGDFGWNDVGSWDEVARLSPSDDLGNVEQGRVIVRDAKNTFIHAESRLIAVVGVEDLIIVQSGDALLICRKGRSQEVKEVVDVLRRKQMNDLL